MANCPKCNCFLKNPNVCSICDYVINEVKKKQYTIPKRSKKQKKVVDKDIDFFLDIWNERPHMCEVSGEDLGEDFNVCFFSHVLAKGAYPRFRHYKKNIVLCSFDWHQAWEFTDRGHRELKWIVELESVLKQEYYRLDKPLKII